MKNTKTQPIVTIGLIVLGTFALLFGLAKMGTKGVSETVVELTTPVVSSDHVKGPMDAPVTLVEYSDFQCPACKNLEPTLRKLSAEYGKELRLVYRNYPLTSLHKNAEAASKAAEAANLQGRFWEYHDMLFNTQDEWSNLDNPQSKFIDYAHSLGLDENKFKTDLTSDAVSAKIKEDVASGNQNNVNATPSFFLNGKYFKIPDSYEGFSAAIVEAVINSKPETTPSTTK